MNDTTAPDKTAPDGAPTHVGTLLCATRMRLGKDLQDIAAVLHIRYNFLVAIEDGRYEDLPGQAYAIGFVRAYADHLGLDGDEVVRRYKEETAGIKRVTRYEYPIPPPESGIPSGALLLIAVVLGMVVYGVWYTMADADRRAADVIQEVPERLAALLKDENAPAPEETQVAAATGDEIVPPPEGDDVIPPPEDGDAPLSEQKPALPAPVQDKPVPQTPAAPATPAPAPAPVQDKTTPAPAPAAPVATPPPAPKVVEAPKPATTQVAATVTPPAPKVEAPKPEAPKPEAPKVEAPKVETPKPAAATPPVQVAAAPPAQTTTPAPAATTPAPQPAAKPPVATPLPAATPVAPTPTAATTPATQPKAPPRQQTASAGKGNIELRAKSDSWIQVRDGEQLLLTRFLRKGEVYKVPDRNGLTLMTLNAGGVDVIVDGETMPPLGEPGSVARGVALDAQKLKASRTP